MYKAIIFDMDGVLCDSEAIICAAAVQFFKEAYNVVVQPEEFKPFVGMGEDRYLGGVAEAHDVTLSLEADKVRVYSTYLELIKGNLAPITGVHAFIDAARTAGLHLAVATSADFMKMNGNLNELGLPAKGFAACIMGNDVERKKPYPDIFLLAAERMGIAAQDCLVVEDAASGVQAAKAAGMTCLGLMSSFDADTLTQAGADFVAPDFTTLPDNLQIW